MKIFISLFSAFVLVATTLAKESPDSPAPTPPFVAPVPENAEWIVSVKYPAKPPADADSPVLPDLRIKEVHSTKTGELKRDQITDGAGKTKENWYVGTLYMWSSPQGQVMAADVGGVSSNPDDLSPSVSSGFPGVGWLKLEYFDKVLTFEKRQCYHYAFQGVEAWVDVETKLPVAYKAGETFYIYKFEAPPTEPLKLPAAFQEAFDAAVKISNSRTRMERILGRK